MNILVILNQEDPSSGASGASSSTARIEVEPSDLTEPQRRALVAVVLDGHDAAQIGLRADTEQIAPELPIRKRTRSYAWHRYWKTGPLRVHSPTVKGLAEGLDRLLLEQRNRYQAFCKCRDEFKAEAQAVIDAGGMPEDVTYWFAWRDGDVAHQGCRKLPPVAHLEVPLTLNVNLVPQDLLQVGSLLPDEVQAPLLRLHKRLRKAADAEADQFIPRAKAQLEAMKALAAFAPKDQIRIIVQDGEQNPEMLVVLPGGKTVRHQHRDRKACFELALCVEMEKGDVEKEGCTVENELFLLRDLNWWIFAQEPGPQHPVTIQTRNMPTADKRYEVTMPIPDGTTHIRLNGSCVYRADLDQPVPAQVKQGSFRVR